MCALVLTDLHQGSIVTVGQADRTVAPGRRALADQGRRSAGLQIHHGGTCARLCPFSAKLCTEYGKERFFISDNANRARMSPRHEAFRRDSTEASRWRALVRRPRSLHHHARDGSRPTPRRQAKTTLFEWAAGAVAAWSQTGRRSTGKTSAASSTSLVVGENIKVDISLRLALTCSP
jgi:hypothetical protein